MSLSKNKRIVNQLTYSGDDELCHEDVYDTACEIFEKGIEAEDHQEKGLKPFFTLYQDLIGNSNYVIKSAILFQRLLDLNLLDFNKVAARTMPLPEIEKDMTTYQLEIKQNLLDCWNRMFHNQGKIQLIKQQDEDINQMQDLFRSSYRYITLMEPASIALAEGMKILKLLPELVEDRNIDDDLPFQELLAIIVRQTIASYKDLKEYHDIVMTVIDEEPITYKMTESVAACSDVLREANLEYLTILSGQPGFLSDNDIEDYNAGVLNKREVEERIMNALAAKMGSQGPMEEQKDEMFERAKADVVNDKRTLHAETVEALL